MRSPAVQPGSNFGHYRILEPLGRGGMATVYRAYEPSLDRHVALKVLPADSLNDPAFTGRFRREARVIAALEHRHIVPIYAYGIDDGVAWMAMRLVPGGALSGRLQDGPFNLGRTVEVLSEVAAALDFAHQRGVLHRDVKPQNVLLDDDGHAYLADFGVARMLEGTAAITSSGVVTGTPLYMSPEQARGEKVDHRTDIYALGIVAYQMLTGRVPFSADTPIAVLMKHVMEPLPLPPASQVPDAAMRAILKCVAKDPAARWLSARRFVDALRAAEGTSAHGPGWDSAQPTLTHVRDSKMRARTLTIAGIGVFLGALFYLGSRVEAPPPASPASLASPIASREPTVASSEGAMRVGDAATRKSELPLAAPPVTLRPAPRGRETQAGPSGLADLGAAVESRIPAPSSSKSIIGQAATQESPGSGGAPAPPEAEAVAVAVNLSSVPTPTPTAASIEDGVSFLVGRWIGRVQQRRNPFMRRELARAVRTECRRLNDPWRVFCRNDWGIIQDWVAIRHDIPGDRYLYEDSEGLKGSAVAGDAEMVYAGTRMFEGKSIAWRLTCVIRDSEAFTLQMEWSKDSKEWHTVYDATFHTAP